MNQRSSSLHRKRGLSLSLSKKNQPQQAHSLLENQNWHICSRPSLHKIAPPVQKQVIVTVHPIQRPPVIIYRYQKSQWEKLQQTNRVKRQQVDRMKGELLNLTKTLELQKQAIPNKYQLCTPLPIPFKQKAEGDFSVNKVADFNPCIKANPAKVKQNDKENQQKFYKINVFSPVTIVQKKESYIVKQSAQNQQKEKRMRSKKSCIDLNSLLQVQNRLNQLIDSTTV